MKEHIKRKIDIKTGALPVEGSDEYKKITSILEKQRQDNPKIQQELDRRFLKARNTALIQDSNGINLTMDKEIRYFLGAFNIRAWELGLLNLPMSFNILESFFKYRKDLFYFELLEEEDYLFSFFDFFTFYTSNKFEDKDIIDYLEKNIIYNYNIGSDINEITFKSDNKKDEFIIGGISLIRRKNEITIFLQIGELENEKKDLPSDIRIVKKGIENFIEAMPKMEKKWIYLDNNPLYIKNLLACRIDLETQTMDARYLLQDMNDSFSVISDDIYGYMQITLHSDTPVVSNRTVRKRIFS